VPAVLDGVAAQLCAANACPLNNGPSTRPDNNIPALIKAFMRDPSKYVSFYIPSRLNAALIGLMQGAE
jgi:hypothetical protein